MRNAWFAMGFVAMGFSAMIAAPPEASAQTCGSSYSIQRGDTLSSIALRIFNDASRWGQVYEHRDNALRIGSNPNNLIVGTSIDVPPCPVGGVTTAPQPRETAAQRQQRVQQGVTGYVPLIEVVTGGDYAPFTDENLVGRGMATQIVEAAFAASDLPNPVKVEFVNDWSSHLTKLVPNNKYDFTFPWFKPDCSDPASLGESDRIRCDYEFSEQPIYIVTINFFGSISDPNPPQAYSDLIGRRLCRPAGYFVFDLIGVGLVPDQNITLERPQGVGECFSLLERGMVDYVAINRFTGEKAVVDAGLSGFVEPVKTLVTPLPLHLLAHQDNAEAVFNWMPEFNKGMQRIKESGEWDDIVGFHLELQRSALKN
ncbi:MAG: hypothetical protein AAF661_17440 [Pseudomonadota bacterium]